jgi:adenylate kinase
LAGSLRGDAQVLQERLQEPDAVGRGVLLDGFPRTCKQAQLLSDVGIRVRFVIHLDVPDDIVTERVDGRRIDPVSGRVYHVKFRAPTDDKIIARLIQRSDDTKEKMKVLTRTALPSCMALSALRFLCGAPLSKELPTRWRW